MGSMMTLLFFSSTIFLSALSLFLIQPMTAKIVLPFLGGTPAVWNTCLFFFQSVLLGGYAYAHIITKKIGFKRQATLHLLLLLIATLFLPINISENTLRIIDKESSPVLWLLVCLTVTVGMPFFIVSTSGPLLQRWFSRTQHSTAHDPYFLYSAGNLGSLLALLSYPAIIEPSLRLTSQSRLWALLFITLIVLVLVCALILPKSSDSPNIKTIEAGQDDRIRPALSRRILWAALAFAPASLMYGVTTYLTTDLVSVPMLWVLPLSVYLLSFILVFARRRILPQRLLNRSMPLVAIVLIFLMLTKLPKPIWLLGALHLLFLFVASMVCHGRLAIDRPDSNHLTRFYLWLSFGGALGGLFNSLIAPVIFNTVIEYPMAIVLSLLLRNRNDPRDPRGSSPSPNVVWSDLVLPLAIFALTAGLAILLPKIGVAPTLTVVLTLSIPLLISYAWAQRPERFALAAGAVMIGSIFYQGLYYGSTLKIERSFFGVLRVARDKSGEFHQLFNGNTGHGRQFVDPARQCEPLSYYHRRGPLGQVFELFNSRSSQKVAVVGLGTGAAICYSKPAQEWIIYEIDPDVAAIAGESRYFTYLRNCAASPARIIIGDARLKLVGASDSQFGLIVLDAFSSDVIPTHLMTRQAFDLYLSKLAPSGILALHTSSQYLDLRPVVADLAADAGLIGFVNTDLGPFPNEEDKGKDSSQWMIIARNGHDLGNLVLDKRWQPLEGRSRFPVWTDDYSNIIGVFKW